MSPLGLDSLGVTLGGAEATLEAAEEPPEATEGAFGLSPPPVVSAPWPSSDISLQRRPIHASVQKQGQKGVQILEGRFCSNTQFTNIQYRMASNVLWRMQQH